MDATKRKVLIVEDRFILYDQLRSFFKKQGYDVIGHDDGRAVDNYDDAVQLLKENKPHIAVLDVELKGRKDGLELASYIKEHFYTFILVLTDHDNYENKKRAELIDTDEFYFKMKKSDMMRHLDNFLVTKSSKFIDGVKTKGAFFKAVTINVKKQTEKKNGAKRSDYDPLDIETLIKWEDIICVESNNNDKKNTVVMHDADGETDHIVRNTLEKMEEQLPYHFIRFNDSQIVNFNRITSRILPKQTTYFINEDFFKISDKYKESAFAKINLLAGYRK